MTFPSECTFGFLGAATTGAAGLGLGAATMARSSASARMARCFIVLAAGFFGMAAGRAAALSAERYESNARMRPCAAYKSLR